MLRTPWTLLQIRRAQFSFCCGVSRFRVPARWIAGGAPTGQRGQVRGESGWRANGPTGQPANGPTRPEQDRNRLSGAMDRAFVCSNILCLEHHVLHPYDSFTNPKPTILFFLRSGPPAPPGQVRGEGGWRANGPTGQPANGPTRPEQGRNRLPGAMDRDFVCSNILCLEHHVPHPYDSFTNPTPTNLFFLRSGPPAPPGQVRGRRRLARQPANGPTGQRSHAARAGSKSIARGNGS